MSKEDFSQYGKDFQETLCHLILVDRPFADQMFEVINVNFLELKYLQTFVKLVMDYREKYTVHPTEKIMTSILRTGIGNEPEPVQQQLRNFFARISKTQIEDSQYIIDTALDFCRKQKLKEAMLKSVKLLKNSSFDEISQVIKRRTQAGI